MKLLTRIRSRSQRGATDDVPRGTPHEQLPIDRYDQLTTKQISSAFSDLSQVELAEIEAYERAHGDRKPVLDKLRYMRSPEPLPGYDALAQRDVIHLLQDADTARVRAIRDYERKFRRRHEVMSAAAKALPSAAANPNEEDRRGEKALRTKTGIEDRTNRLA